MKNLTASPSIFKNPFLIWVFSLLLHSLLLMLVYSIFWASYSETTLEFLKNLSYQLGIAFSVLSTFLIISLGFSFSAIFAQLFTSIYSNDQKIRVLILYVLVFFVAFIPLLLWVDRHIIATFCVLSGVSLLIINYKKNTSFYITTFVGTFLCMVGLFWSVKGFGFAMAASIPFSLWYLKKENFKQQIPQVVILVSLIMLSLVWDLVQDQLNTDKISIRFSIEKIEKNVPKWLLDENLIETNWTKNDFKLWLNGSQGIDWEEKNTTQQHFSTEAIQKITDFLLYYDSVAAVEDNPLLKFRYVFLQMALLVFWFLFLGNYNLSRYRLITYWTLVFLIWIWTKYISLDTENGFLLALCAYGGLLPLIGANQFKDIMAFKMYQKIIFVVLLLLIVVEFSGNIAIYISKSLSTRQNYLEAKMVLENIYKKNPSPSENIQKKNYLDWNANLINKTLLPFYSSIITPFGKEELENNSIIPVQEFNRLDKKEEKLSTTPTLDFSTFHFIFPAKISKSQTDILTIYFSEHKNRVIEWELAWKTEDLEVWRIRN